MSERESWPKPLPDEVEFIADDAMLNPHEQAVLKRAAALLREQEREPEPRWRDAAIQAKNDLRAIEAAFRDATPVGEDGPDPPIGPGHIFAVWTSPAVTMRWIEDMERGDGVNTATGTPPTSTSEGVEAMARALNEATALVAHLWVHCDTDNAVRQMTAEQKGLFGSIVEAGPEAALADYLAAPPEPESED